MGLLSGKWRVKNIGNKKLVVEMRFDISERSGKTKEVFFRIFCVIIYK